MNTTRQLRTSVVLFNDLTNHQNRVNMCLRCLGRFYTPESLEKHQRLCTREDFMSVVHVLPAPDTEQAHIKFRQFRNTFRAPFVIYADFESILEPMERRVKQTLYNQQHKISAACAMLVTSITAFPHQTWLGSGENALSEFLTQIIKWESECIEYLKNNIPMKPLSRAKQEEYDTATQCHICRKPLLGVQDPKGITVRDHDHITGLFIGAAHQSCNLQRRVNYQIPVFFHNFRGYDSHLIVHEFPNIQNRKLKVIGQNMEKYLQIQWGEHIVFRDSLQFLTASLDSLVKSLAMSGRDNFQYLHETMGVFYPEATDEMIQMLEQKGVFCYDYIDKFERLGERVLPPREQFYNRLAGEECSEENYARAQKVWRDFKCGDIDDYMRLYLLCDVALLADVFQKFRKQSLEEYQLDPAYYMSSPQLAWSALLKYIDRPIHLITDPEMYRMIQPNIRGGICHASVRYARANNKFMGALYDPTKPSSYILYVDANNLYGWAMSQPLPDDEYEWVSPDDCRAAMAAFQDKASRDLWYDREKHYIFEVDMDYPPELHERDDDYPLAPETMTIEAAITGEKQHQLRAKYFGAACPFSRKLVCSFLPKRKYVVHGHLLRFYLDRGMKLVKIHRAVCFTASAYFEPYIRNNTQKRALHKNDPNDKNFYKLLNNAVFGKTIENVAKRSDIRLVNEEEKARQLAEKPHCLDFRVFEDNLIGVEMRKLRHNINKPFQHGFCVLEWSKLKMYQFYALLKDAFQEKVRMLYTDTDSFFLQFFVDDLSKELRKRRAVFRELDFADISDRHPTGLHDDTNAGEVGYFKDECKGDPVVEFVGLRPKMYSFTVMDAADVDSPNTVAPVMRHKAVAKGISRANIKRFTHEDYLTMFREGEARKVSNRRIASQLHQVFS